MNEDFTLFAVVQHGRLSYEAILLTASIQRTNPNVQIKLLEPQPGPLWPNDPRVDHSIRRLLGELGAEFIPFHSRVFGATYPHGNKIEALSALPLNRPFLFLDTDTLVIGDLTEVPFDFDRPTASLKREGTWPKGDKIDVVWKSLYQHFELDFESSLDLTFQSGNWERYLYFNAGFFFGRNPREFGELYLEIAREIRDNPPSELDGQALTPWLDQIALPLVIHKLGGGRETLQSGFLDSKTTCHYRTLPLLFARECDTTINFLYDLVKPNKIKKILKNYDPAKRLIYQGGGAKIREIFNENRPKSEKEIRKAIKAAGLWLR